MSTAGRDFVADRYPQDFVQEPCRDWITRSKDDKVVLSLWESGRYSSHSSVMPWGHGDGLIHLGGLSFAIGTKYEVLPFDVKIGESHLSITEKPAYKVSGASSSENILLGNGFGRVVVVTKYPTTTWKRVRTADQAAFFASTKYSGIEDEMFDTEWGFSEGAVQGVGFVDPQTIVVISGGANVQPRVKTYDVLTGAETVHPRMDVSHISGSDIEAEGFDQGKSMICWRSGGNVQFSKEPAF